MVLNIGIVTNFAAFATNITGTGLQKKHLYLYHIHPTPEDISNLMGFSYHHLMKPSPSTYSRALSIHITPNKTRHTIEDASLITQVKQFVHALSQKRCFVYSVVIQQTSCAFFIYSNV